MLISVLCYGDSNTYGLIPNETKRYSFFQRYPGILQKNLGDEYRIIEDGLVGRTTVYNDKRYGRCGINYLPICLEINNPLDYLIIMLGTNDCKKSNARSEQDFCNGITKIITTAKEHLSDKTKIILISPILLGDEVVKNDNEFDVLSVKLSRKLADIYNDVAESQSCLFLNAADYAEASNADFQHMTKAGHKNLADAIAELITAKS